MTTTTSQSSLPTQEEALGLHRRLLEGDVVASSEVAMAYLDWLAEWVIARNPSVDRHLCETAAEDALLGLMRRPASYKPERASLEAYLRMSASGDLKNALRSEARRRQRQANLEAVELSPDMRKYLQDGDGDPARIVEIREWRDERMRETIAVPQAVLDGLSPQEREVLELMHIKERKTEIFAAVLGISHLPPDDQRSEVKRVKDRLTKRVERAGHE
ncbi:MAG: hypothetical protein NVS4B2_28880 [Chloroflexota bacterium]